MNEQLERLELELIVEYLHDLLGAHEHLEHFQLGQLAEARRLPLGHDQHVPRCDPSRVDHREDVPPGEEDE